MVGRSEPGESARSKPRAAGPWFAAVGVGIGAWILFQGSALPWLYDDAFDLGCYLHAEERHLRYWMHLLYLPLARLLHGAGDGPGAYQALFHLSHLCGAVGVAALYIAFSRWQSARVAFAAVLLVATLPGVRFFASTAEVHSLLFAVSALAVLSCLRWTARARIEPANKDGPSDVVRPVATPRPIDSRSLAVRAAVAAACSAALFLAHQTGALLVPAVVALVCTTGETTLRARLREGGLLALAAASALAAAVIFVRLVRGGGDARSPLDFISEFGGGSASASWWSAELFLPYGVLLAALALYLPLRCGERRGAVVALVALVPSLVFFGWWGVSTLGGYFVGAVPFLALCVADGLAALQRAKGGAWVLVLVALGVGVNVALYTQQTEAAFGWVPKTHLVSRAERVATVLPAGGLLVSFEPSCQPVDLFLPNVREQNFSKWIAMAVHNNWPPAAVGAALTEEIVRRTGAGSQPLVVETTGMDFAREHPVLQAYFSAFEARMAERHGLEPDWLSSAQDGYRVVPLRSGP